MKQKYVLLLLVFCLSCGKGTDVRKQDSPKESIESGDVRRKISNVRSHSPIECEQFPILYDTSVLKKNDPLDKWPVVKKSTARPKDKFRKGRFDKQWNVSLNSRNWDRVEKATENLDQKLALESNEDLLLWIFFVRDVQDSFLTGTKHMLAVTINQKVKAELTRRKPQIRAFLECFNLWGYQIYNGPSGPYETLEIWANEIDSDNRSNRQLLVDTEKLH